MQLSEVLANSIELQSRGLHREWEFSFPIFRTGIAGEWECTWCYSRRDESRNWYMGREETGTKTRSCIYLKAC